MGGVTPKGFVRDSVQTIKARIESRQLATISPDLDVGPESLLGQLNSLMAEELGASWELLEHIYNSMDADKAEGVSLSNVTKLTGILRHGARPSRVEARVNLDAGTELIPGLHFAHVSGKPAARFTPLARFIAPNDGFHPVPFVSEELGPVEAPEHTLTVIVSPGTQGWNSITNPNPTVLGALTETDQELRIRRLVELAAKGNATIEGITNRVAGVQGVQTVHVFENTTDSVDANGLPPHSIEVLIFDGVDPLPIENDVAQAIWDSRGGGVEQYGSTSGTARRGDGTEVEVRFSRVTPRKVYASLTVQVNPETYGGTDALKEFFVNSANALQRQGQDVRVRQLDSLVLPSASGAGFPGVLDVTDYRMGYAPASLGTGNLPVGTRQFPYFETDGITVTVTS